jgi:signal-transduction protein with cAMP-binding, CBS, and nucleotidyltransferase domain
MLCPVCNTDNFEGEDSCANCGADLATSDSPRSAITYRDTVLGDHLDALGLGSFRVVPPSMPANDAIRAMHEAGTDCLLVVEDDRLVGIFTDRDAVVKAADKRLQLYRVEDFMTRDPVVLRHDDTLAVAIHKMAVGEFRHIPVVEGGVPIGVVAAADVFRHLVAGLG